MDTSFFDKLILEIKSLDIITEPSFLTKETEDEEVIGTIKDEDTKKLFYYLMKVNRDKILRMEKMLSKYEGLNRPVCELKDSKSLLDKSDELIGEQYIASILLRKNLEREIPATKGCPYIHIVKGWKVARLKCEECKKHFHHKILIKDEDIDELFTRFDKYKRNADLN